MARNLSLVLAFAVAGVGSLGAKPPVTFRLNEPITITGVPPVTLGPGTYVVRAMDSGAGMKVVQVLSQHQDYVYTTVLAVPATRPYADDKRQFVFSETPLGGPPALHFWFPPGESSGHEFINPGGLRSPQFTTAPESLHVR